MEQLSPEQILRNASIERSPEDTRTAQEIVENLERYGTPKPLTTAEKALIDQRHNMTANIKSPRDPRMGLGRTGTKAFKLVDIDCKSPFF